MIADGDDRAAAVDALTTAAEQAGDADLADAFTAAARVVYRATWWRPEPGTVIAALLRHAEHLTTNQRPPEPGGLTATQETP